MQREQDLTRKLLGRMAGTWSWREHEVRSREVLKAQQNHLEAAIQDKLQLQQTAESLRRQNTALVEGLRGAEAMATAAEEDKRRAVEARGEVEAALHRSTARLQALQAEINQQRSSENLSAESMREGGSVAWHVRDRPPLASLTNANGPAAWLAPSPPLALSASDAADSGTDSASVLRRSRALSSRLSAGILRGGGGGGGGGGGADQSFEEKVAMCREQISWLAAENKGLWRRVTHRTPTKHPAPSIASRAAFSPEDEEEEAFAARSESLSGAVRGRGGGGVYGSPGLRTEDH